MRVRSADRGGGTSSARRLYRPLMPSQIDEVKTQMAASVEQFLAGVTQGPATWKPTMRKKNISFYTGTSRDHSSSVGSNSSTGSNSSASGTRFCCVTHTRTSAQELMPLFVASTQEALVKNTRVLFDDLLETRLVQTVAAPTPMEPFASIYVTYSSFQTAAFMDNRDLCLAVATNLHHDHETQVTTGYCVWESIQLADFPKQVSIRRDMLTCSGLYFRTHLRPHPDGESMEQTTKIVYVVELSAGASTTFAPQMLTQRIYMERLGAQLTRLTAFLRRKQLDTSRFVPKSQWPSKRSAKSCNRCLKNFRSILSKRVNCGACGEVVCCACYGKEVVNLFGVGTVQIRVCWDCHGGWGGLHETGGGRSSISHSRSASCDRSEFSGTVLSEDWLTSPSTY